MDSKGFIRFRYTSKDGTLLTYDVPAFYYYHQALIERNYLGQILKQMYIPGAGHHSLVETDGGDYLINSSINQITATSKISSICSTPILEMC